LVAEVANSRRSIALHSKRHDYARNGVREYLVLAVRERRMYWFDLREDRELTPDADGVVRVQTFPGLWIDVDAVLDNDPRLLTVLEQGLATPEHAAFVRTLAAAHKPPAKPGRKRGGKKRS
jgi:hypothetical protein